MLGKVERDGFRGGGKARPLASITIGDDKFRKIVVGNLHGSVHASRAYLADGEA
jgi:hypothetical protein